MTDEMARSILQTMLDGVDPTTGECLAEDHLCNAPEVIRALHRAVIALSRNEREASAHAGDLRQNAGRPWTREDLDTLERLYRSGNDVEHICAIMQRRRRGVIKQLTYLGLFYDDKSGNRKSSNSRYPRSGMQWTRAEDQQLDQMIGSRCSMEDISQKLGRSAYAIFCRMERHELGHYPSRDASRPDDPPPWTQEDSATLQQMFRAGHSIAEMAAAFRRSQNSIAARLFYMGLTPQFPLAWPLNAAGNPPQKP